jgi:hypothetical protein
MPAPNNHRSSDDSSPVVSFETWQREFYKYRADGKLLIDTQYGGLLEDEPGGKLHEYELNTGYGVPGLHDEDLMRTGFDEVGYVDPADVVAVKRGLERGLIPKKDGRLRGLDYDNSKLDEQKFIALISSGKKSFDGAFIQAGGTISERLITPSTQPRLGYHPVEYNHGLAPSQFRIRLAKIDEFGQPIFDESGMPIPEGELEPRPDRKGFFRWKSNQKNHQERWQHRRSWKSSHKNYQKKRHYKRIRF